MMSAASRSQAVRQSLHLSIDPSPYKPPPMSLSPDSNSPLSSAARSTAGTTPTSESSSTAIMYSVLCLYDFESDDPDQLSFKKGEILDVVKEEEGAGWWAAMRGDVFKVGWIPSAFVRPLSEGMAQSLRRVPEENRELRVYDYEAEQLYTSAPIASLSHLYEPLSEPSSSPTLYEWEPTPRHTNGRTTNNVAQDLSRIAHETALAEKERLLAEDRKMHHPLPSLIPIPQPPSATLSLSINKPTPPTPTERLADLNNGERQRSNSSPLGRSSRRRKVGDEPPLPRLSTLGANAGPRGIEDPDGLNKVRADSADKIKKLTGSEEALAFHNAVRAQASTSLPWYLRPLYADQLQLDRDGNVRMGTLAALVERLTSDPHGREQLKAQAAESALRNAFLMTFRTFTTADTLFDMLTEKFRMDHPDALTTDTQFNEWKEKKLLPTQHRVLTVFTVWLEDHRLLEEEPHIAQRLTEFLKKITSPPPLAITAMLIIKTIERLTFSPPQSFSPMTPKRRRKSRGGKLDLLKQDSTNLAEQLCLLEHKLYTKISPQECLRYAKTQSGEAIEHLAAFCSTHDKLAAWVKMSILNNDNLGRRANTVDFWIKVAEKCRNMNNFASMSALINALSSTVINRLHLTWAHAHRKPSLDALLKYNEPTGGFSGYRNLLQQADGPCVPFIGMYLTDIVHIQDQFSDETISSTPTGTKSSGTRENREPLICFLKRQRWYEVISFMLKFQTKPYNIAESESTQSFISGNLAQASVKDQTWFWSKSQEVQQSELAHADIRKGLEEAGF